MSDYKYPIAEIFTAPQGEGKYAGTLMNFVRFAGCTVGKPFKNNGHHFPIYTEQCTLYDGRTFACDTDFRVKERLTTEEIMAQFNAKAPFALLTGGEPLMQKELLPFVRALKNNRYQVHVETSGTIPVDLNQPIWRLYDWICVSPKKGFLDDYANLNVANEFKLLVDDDFDWNTVPASIRAKERKICISAINNEHTLDQHNIQKCVQLQLEHTHVRITVQQHKILGTR